MYLLGPNYAGGLEVEPASLQVYDVINEKNIGIILSFILIAQYPLQTLCK